MEFLITREELQILFHIGRSYGYKMHEQAQLSSPIAWCGNKCFCLRKVASELAIANGKTEPCDKTILQYWNSILQIRAAKAAAKAKKKACN